jgi:restriction endonuclease S subunit
LPLSRGSAQPNISGSALLNLDIPVPPADEQLKIVRVLDVLEGVLAKYEKHLVTIKKMADMLRERLFKLFSR